MYRQSEKKLVKQQYILHMSWQYGKLRPTNGWDRFASLRHPSKFQQVSCLGSVTAWHYRSGRQPNFAALNRGRHLYSAGRPSHWASAHILVVNVSLLRLYWLLWRIIWVLMLWLKNQFRKAALSWMISLERRAAAAQPISDNLRCEEGCRRAYHRDCSTAIRYIRD